jgi:hypothetical protein
VILAVDPNASHAETLRTLLASCTSEEVVIVDSAAAVRAATSRGVPVLALCSSALAADERTRVREQLEALSVPAFDAPDDPEAFTGSSAR